MRKVIKRPDGTEEVVEGTADEIAEYERQIREGAKPRPKKPPVLRGAEVDGKPLTDAEIGAVRLMRMGLLPQKEYVPVPYSPVIEPIRPYWLGEVPCGICGVIGCRQLHVWSTVINGTSTIGLKGDDVPLTSATIEISPYPCKVTETLQ